MLMTPEQLKQWRAKNGYSQAGLAKLLGVDVMTVSRWERNTREIPSFLHLALDALERQGGDESLERAKRKRKGGRNAR